MNVVLQQTSVLEATGQFLAASKSGRVGIRTGANVGGAIGSGEKSGREAVSVDPGTGAGAALRMRKDAQELAVMRRAAILAGQVVEQR